MRVPVFPMRQRRQNPSDQARSPKQMVDGDRPREGSRNPQDSLLPGLSAQAHFSRRAAPDKLPSSECMADVSGIRGECFSFSRFT